MGRGKAGSGQGTGGTRSRSMSPSRDKQSARKDSGMNIKYMSPVSGSATNTATDDSVNLKPKISLFNGVSMIVGSIIGSGIFVSPKGVLEQTGSVGLSLVVWSLCGLFSMMGAYCYAELGTAITRSGADYAYMYEAFGPFVAFLRMWVEAMIVRPCTQAIVALTFAYYVIEPLYAGCDQPDSAVRLLAVVAIGNFLKKFSG